MGGLRLLGSPCGDELCLVCPGCREAAGVVAQGRGGEAIWRCGACGFAWVQEGPGRGVLRSPGGEVSVGCIIF